MINKLTKQLQIPSVRAAVMLLFVSGALMVVWSFVVPIFEAPDEPAHWQYVMFMHRHHDLKLPLYGPAFVEGNSPPLYYALMALFGRWSDLPRALNPNRPLSQHSTSGFEQTATDLQRFWPVRECRLATIVISLGTVLFCFLSGLELSGRISTAVLTGGIAAFLPQFSFRGMNVSNDAMETACCAALTFLIVRLMKRGADRRTLILSAVAFAAAFLSKPISLFFALPLTLAILYPKGSFKERISRLWVLGISLVLIAPWVIRNKVLYGDLLAHQAMYKAVAPLIVRKSLYSPWFKLYFFPFMGKSFVGTFGWMNLELKSWMYLIYAALTILSIVGLGIGLLRRNGNAALVLIMLLAIVLNMMVVIYINLMMNQPQGRYMFPVLPAIALIVALGFESLPRWNSKLSVGLVGLLLVFNIFILSSIVYPAYWPPSGPKPNSLQVNFGPTLD